MARYSLSYPMNEDRILRIAYPATSAAILVVGILGFVNNRYGSVAPADGILFLFVSGIFTLLGDGNCKNRKTGLIGTAVITVVLVISVAMLILKSADPYSFAEHLLAALFYCLILVRRIINMRKHMKSGS